MVLKTGAIHGSPGFQPPTPRPDYTTYKSPHSPQFTVQTHYRGVNARTLSVFGRGAALFGVAAGAAVLYMASDVPKVRIDIMERIPFIGSHYHREVPPEDNPF